MKFSQEQVNDTVLSTNTIPSYLEKEIVPILKQELDQLNIGPREIEILKNSLTDCPNCLTSQQCYGPHLTKGSEFHYYSEDGYYLLENYRWTFVPFEKPFTSKVLIDIATTLHFLNIKNYK